MKTIKLFITLSLLMVCTAINAQKLSGTYEIVTTGGCRYYITFNGSTFTTSGIDGMPYMKNYDSITYLLDGFHPAFKESFWDGTVTKLSEDRYQLTITNLRDPKRHYKSDIMRKIYLTYTLIKDGNSVYIEGFGDDREDRLHKMDAQAMFELGLKYFNERNYTEAKRLITQAANNGSADAQYYLGECYQYGKAYLDIEKNETEALKWYTKAANNGSADAQVELGKNYLYGWLGLPENKAEAVQWYLKAAENGSAEGQYEIGGIYVYSRYGVQGKQAEGIEWLRKSAEQGYDDAIFTMACCYLNGKGVAIDYEEAANWFIKSAEKDKSHLVYAAEAYAKAGNKEKAMQLLQEATIESKYDFDDKGEVLYILGDKAGAKQCWEKVKQLDPEYYKDNDTDLNKYMTGRK